MSILPYISYFTEIIDSISKYFFMLKTYAKQPYTNHFYMLLERNINARYT
nr:MAG TPA: hypothetical protein [Caudoviricetes sp.]